MATATFDNQPSALDKPFWSVFALNWEKAAFLGLIVLALVTRFYALGDRVMSHDESLHTQYAWYLYANGNYAHDPVMHGPLKFHLTAFFYWLLGDNDFTARIPTAIMGVAAVWLCYFFRPWLGRWGALMAGLFLLISPYQLYYSRYIRDEPYVMVWGLLMALMILYYVKTRQMKFLYGLVAVSALFHTTMETSFIYIAIFLVFCAMHFAWELYLSQWPEGTDAQRKQFIAVLGIAVLAAAVGVAIFLYNDRLGLEGTAFTPDVNQPDEAALTASTSGLALWADVAWLIALGSGTFALWTVVHAFGEGIRRFATLDVVMILGLFVLPQASAFIVAGLGFNPINYNPPPMNGFEPGIFFASDMGVTILVVALMFAASVLLGYIWNWPVFLIASAIFWAIYIPLYTTFFTNGNGLATGLVGSLGYWLSQHGVRRGSQPWYYYLVINLPMYEFLPTLGTLIAGGLGLRWLVKRPTKVEIDTGEPKPVNAPLHFPVLAFLGFWAVLAVVAFSIAGEKMPWLTTHIVLPMILLTGWLVGQLIEKIDWAHFRQQRAWLVAVLVPLTLVAVFNVFGALLGANPPFQGSTITNQNATLGFVSALLVAGIGIAALYQLGQPLGWMNVLRLTVLSFFGLLALITARSAFIASYVNYDYANEFLVYAHGARGVKTVLEQIEDISERTQDGFGLKVAYDDDIAWPMTWYFRDFKNQAYFADQPTRDKLDAPVVVAGSQNWSRVETLLKDSYYQFEYIRMVWPMQDYFPQPDKTIGERILVSLADGEMRQALFNIWWNRDYTKYGELTAQSFDLAQWPLADRMRLYVRKDIAAQIWQYGVGPTVLDTQPPIDPYADSRQTLTASAVFGSQGQGDGQFDGPRGVAVAQNGDIYVADSRNHRIQVFDANGQFKLAFGVLGKIDDGTGLNGGTFNEPWGVAVGPDGSVYVADTWNHRIQKFTANGEFITMWGRFGQDGGLDAFYGPRAVAVGPDGRVFVADTGNKRVVVFDGEGNGISSIGQGGFEPGFLDEPVGVGVDASGTLYVADTWNQRVQLFRSDSVNNEYLFSGEIPVEAWPGQSVENKPYLALDSQGNIYLTEPEGYRVLVFNSEGQFTTTWGDAGNDASTFALLSGVAVDADGNVIVADPGNSRVLKFPPAVP